jgi:hypothetical protein
VDFVEQMSLNNQRLQQKANAPFAAQSWQSKNNRMKDQRKMRMRALQKIESLMNPQVRRGM